MLKNIAVMSPTPKQVADAVKLYGAANCSLGAVDAVPYLYYLRPETPEEVAEAEANKRRMQANAAVSLKGLILMHPGLIPPGVNQVLVYELSEDLWKANVTQVSRSWDYYRKTNPEFFNEKSS